MALSGLDATADDFSAQVITSRSVFSRPQSKELNSAAFMPGF
jgi:hypothetical protein